MNIIEKILDHFLKDDEYNFDLDQNKIRIENEAYALYCKMKFMKRIIMKEL